VLLLCVLGASAQYWDSADQQLADKAEEKKVSLCGENQMEMDESSREGIRASLEAMSADNFLLEAMKVSESQEEFQAEVQSSFDPGFMAVNAGPLGFAFFVMGVYFVCCCWTCCPCCGCCRCCKKERSIPKMYKFGVVFLLVGLLVGMLVAALNASAGFATTHTGMATTGCESAKLVDAMLSGQDEPHFLGLKVALTTFGDLKDKLSETSTFITDVKNIMSDTTDISDAVTLASSTMQLLIDMMNLEANVHPKDDAGNDLFHACTLCGPLSEALAEAQQALESGTASALDGARDQVNKQLSGESLASLADSMESATAPLLEFKDLLHTFFGTLVLEDTIPDALEALDSYGPLGSIFLILGGFALMACAFCTMGCWICVDKEKEKAADNSPEIEEVAPAANPENGDQALNPPEDKVKEYRGKSRWCACVTWCCACYYIMFAFFIGGVFTALCFPLASVCLIMEDMDSQMLDDIQGATGMNLTGEEGEMMADMVDQCFQGLGEENPIMLKLIKVTENGTTMTMYEKVVDETRNMIQDQFDAIGSSGGGSDGSFPKLNDDDNVQKLKQLLRETYIDGMMLLDDSANNVPDFTNLAASDLSDYLAGSARCPDFTIPSNLDLPNEGDTILGIDSFAAQLNGPNFGNGNQDPPIQAGRCAQEVTCPTSGANKDACEEANTLMSLRARLENAMTFKCKTFTKAGVYCDTKDTLDCLTDGQTTSETFDCDLATFTQMVNDFDTRLTNVFGHLDTITEEFMPKIQGQLQDIVNEELMDPITAVADGLTCGFLKTRYAQTIDGMCYGMVIGLKGLADAYVLCAIMALLLIFVIYVVWRIVNDNVTKDAWSVSPYEAGETGDQPANDLRNLANSAD